MKAALLINDNAGSIRGDGMDFKKEILGLLNSHGIKADTFDVDSFTAEQLITSGYEVLIACGGDGTINHAAGIVSGTSLPLGVIPSGTLNHFAKDNKIPLNNEDAVKTIAAFNILKVDTAEVNGKVFVNNSSVGLYPKMVRKREKLGGSKWVSMLRAFAFYFHKLPLLDVVIMHDGDQLKLRIPFIFVGNNEYRIELFNLGTRDNLRSGKLSVFYPLKKGRFILLRFVFLRMLKLLKEEKYFTVIHTKEVTVVSEKSALHASFDGEIEELNTPLKYKIRPLSLNLIVPHSEPSVNP